MKKHNHLILLITTAIVPRICYAANPDTNNYNWGAIIGSAIVAGIFALAIAIEQQKKKNRGKNILFREIKAPRTAKIIKAAIAIIGFYFLYNFIILLSLPDWSVVARKLTAIILTILTTFLHSKFFNRPGTNK